MPCVVLLWWMAQVEPLSVSLFLIIEIPIQAPSKSLPTIRTVVTQFVADVKPPLRVHEATRDQETRSSCYIRGTGALALSQASSPCLRHSLPVSLFAPLQKFRSSR